MKYKDFYSHLLSENSDIQHRLEKLREAGQTQRGIPESVMDRAVTNILNVGGPAALTHQLEHIGDLSDRASRSNAIENVYEKVERTLRAIAPSKGNASLEEEIENGFKNNAEYISLKKSGFEKLWEKMVDENDRSRWDKREAELDRLKSEIESSIKHAKEVTTQELKKYVEAHKNHNLPITTLGRLGKKAAIDLGELNIKELDRTLKKIMKWLDEYEKSGWSDEKLLQGYDENRHDYIEGEEIEEENDDGKI